VKSNLLTRRDFEIDRAAPTLLPFPALERPTSTERHMAAKDVHIQPPSTDQLETSRFELYDGQAFRPFSYKQRLIVRSIGKIIFVRTKEIEWCQACENYIQLHSGRQSHLLRGTMMQMENQLDPSRFVRISRSAIVNLDFVQEIRSVPTRGRVVRLLSGTEINVGREYRSRLKRVLTVGGCNCPSE
jgi:DNA-binding LytR/AlgR family response regulator